MPLTSPIRALALALVFLTLALTSSCGWQLRGLESNTENKAEKLAPTESSESMPLSSSATETTDNAIQSTEVVATQAPATHSTNASSNITAEESETDEKHEPGTRLVMLERNHGLSLALNRVAWDNKHQFNNQAKKWLVIEREKLEKRPLTVTETGVAAQYQLILTITFSVKHANGELITPSQQIVSWRSYDFDAKLIVAKSQEEEALIVEMREELAQRMLSILK